ncbi:redoxin domain-containing protein [Aquabacterium sp.]|uniref:redoxin domain-containing protein n=1 Tax=Aquabacterium sp. TaxID=1872578 RepID=UPI002C8EB6BC|nr:redoxin domain-containing protein [Aquabacterium sp.]HSW05909.1 redoxin domain-containing protein [Aquabacterium sp.]
MTTTLSNPPVAPGDLAPDFVLPAVAGPGTVSLADYRGSSALFLALMLGLWCPFCRRQLIQLAGLEGRLKALGVQSVAVVATAPENARLYFRFRPTTLCLASDPGLTTHRAYRVPKPEPTPAMLQEMETIRINPDGIFPAPLPIAEVASLLQQRDGYVTNPVDQGDAERQWPQLKALFMIDRAGIVRWASIECGDEGMAGLGKMASAEVIIDAARACAA